MAKNGMFIVSAIVKFIPAVTGMVVLVDGFVKTASIGNLGVKFAGRTSGMTEAFFKAVSTV